MLKIDLANYRKQFPKYPGPVQHGKSGWIHGTWMIGQQYRSKHGYYGEYPPSFLERVHALTHKATNVLHLFSGMVEPGLWSGREVTFDINPNVNPDIQGDAHVLSKYFATNEFDLIIADPPYSEEDANRYGTPMVKRNTVMRECYPIISPGGCIFWLDQVYPMFRKEVLSLIGTIGLWRSTNHRFRGLSIFRKR